MQKHKRSLRFIAQSYRLDPEETLISLWYLDRNRYGYLVTPGSIVKGRDYASIKNYVSKKSKLISSTSVKNILVEAVKVVYRNHDFSKIGHSVDTLSHVTIQEVVQIYDELVKDFFNHEDPIQPAGVKDEQLLESAIFHPQTSYDGEHKYPTIESAAAALMYGITHNHAFYNGNKRTAIVSTLVFLDRHNILVTCDENELFRVSIALADHKLVPPENLYPDAEIEELAYWINSNSKLVQKGERPITQRRFKQILSHFNCEIMPDGRIQRVIYKKDFLKGTRPVVLVTRQARFEPGTEGRQMNRKVIKTIREELQLTHEYGIDSEQFYEMSELSPAEFIHQYKKLLRRLARV